MLISWQLSNWTNASDDFCYGFGLGPYLHLMYSTFA